MDLAKERLGLYLSTSSIPSYFQIWRCRIYIDLSYGCCKLRNKYKQLCQCTMKLESPDLGLHILNSPLRMFSTLSHFAWFCQEIETCKNIPQWSKVFAITPKPSYLSNHSMDLDEQRLGLYLWTGSIPSYFQIRQCRIYIDLSHMGAVNWGINISNFFNGLWD